MVGGRTAGEAVYCAIKTVSFDSLNELVATHPGMIGSDNITVSCQRE